MVSYKKEMNMNNNNKALIKAALMFGGGFLLFIIVKNYKNKKTTPKSFDAATSEKKETKPPTEQELQNAEIVATAYSSAMQNNEPASRLSELNKELTKEFGMRCYMDKSGKLVVSDVSGTTILTK